MVTGRLRQRSWETPDGEKRSVAEIEADEVGASLKWATAKVERTSQRGTGVRNSTRGRQAERGGDFNDAPRSKDPNAAAPPFNRLGQPPRPIESARIAGQRSRHGAAASNAAEARSTRASSSRRPTICSPIGRPSAVNPAGTVAAG
jgi:single-stranded DNA-binding protein